MRDARFGRCQDEVAQWILDEVRRLVCELLAIESVNPDLVTEGSGESAIAEFVTSRLRSHGLQVEVVEAFPDDRACVLLMGDAELELGGFCDDGSLGCEAFQNRCCAEACHLQVDLHSCPNMTRQP